MSDVTLHCDDVETEEGPEPQPCLGIIRALANHVLGEMSDASIDLASARTLGFVDGVCSAIETMNAEPTLPPGILATHTEILLAYRMVSGVISDLHYRARRHPELDPITRVTFAE